ncbi:ORF6N domain-containing protein [Clostridium sporogenes]|uniref:ORF6N domain-containing protein n=1 Tax=Clostridium sporogenes TaxID=1509 RepID=UPI002238A0B5|nr:ORF6N domain-containing protein [Clostridium sporogenes]MCW6111900.1 ORF6N domain-containing protein [Clostridium sporogenes]
MKKINLTIENGQPVATEIKAVEINGQRVLTTEQLAEVYGVEPIRIQQGFIRNKEKFQKGKHYFRLIGEELKEFKANYLKDSSLKYASELMLWTERGANRHCKILDTDKAWEQFDNLEETYFRVKENKVEVNQLSPELQMFNNLFKSLATTELEQKKLSAAVKETKEEVQAIRDVVKLDTTSWKEDSTNLINKIAQSLGGFEYIREVRREIYVLLDKRMGVNLEQRLTNKRRRMADEGVCKSKRDKLNKVSVIGDDKKLIEGYVSIVKEMAIKYGVKA